MSDSQPFESVVPYPIGESTVARFAHTAQTLGYDGLVVRSSDCLPDTPSVAAVAARYDLDLVEGIELAPETPADASGRLPQLHHDFSIVIVRGGTTTLNRFVSRQRHVDVLAAPVNSDGPTPEVGTIKAAIENDVHLEVDLGPLQTTGGRRVRYLDYLHRLWRLIDHYDAPYVVTVRAASHLTMRSPRELAALGDAIGIGEAAIIEGLDTWRAIATPADASRP